MRDCCDIVPGSVWSRGDSSAYVLGVAEGYVRYETGGEPELLHHSQFRALFSSPYDARKVRSQFSMSLANLVTFHAFWSPSANRMFARSVSRGDPTKAYAPARGSPALPIDAIFVRTYDDRATPNDFFEDLNDVLASVIAYPI